MTQPITIPARLAKRPMFKGMPIPVTTFVDASGLPDFKINDSHQWQRCVIGKLCALCGESLEYYSWFIGGPGQLEHHTFVDSPMHEGCARYAAAVCPFIAYGRGYANHVKGYEGTIVDELAPAETLTNPKTMYLMKVRRDSVKPFIEEGRAFLRTGGFLAVEEIARHR